MFIRLKQLTIMLALCCLFAVPYTASAATGQIQVTVDKLNVRSSPSLGASVISTLPVNTILPVIAEKDNWVQVKLPNGSTGWLANWLVKPVQSSSKQKLIESQAANLNVRSGPSQTFPVVYTINPNTKYTLLQKSGQWIQIQLPNNQKGWVASWLVKESEGSGASKPAKPAPNATPPAAQKPPIGPAAQTPSGTPASSASAQQGNVITVSFAPYVYPEPNDKLPAIGQINPGEPIKKLGQAAGWYQIDYYGVKAWIPSAPPKEPTATDILGSGDAAGQNHNPPASSGSGSNKATVTGDNVNLRSEPNTKSAIITMLAQGSALTVLNQQGDWYQVQTGNQTGWIAGWLIDVDKQQDTIPPGTPSISVINTDTNVRSGPGTNYDIVGRVQPGERYQVVKQEDKWFQIQLKDGTTGYIAGWLVSVDGLPIVVKGNELVNKVIVVDPGHGGNDNGATGTSFSTLEKTINLQVALMLKNKLEAAGAKVIMTRNDDRKLTLQDRVDTAVSNNADIFVSIHHNTHPNTLTNGSIVFYYSKGNSSKLAGLVQNQLVKATGYKDMQSRFGDYFVLRENSRVAILAEIGFLTNYNEEIRLRSAKQQDLAAEGIYKGIVQYFASLSSE